MYEMWVELSFNIPIDNFFTYLVPDELKNDLKVGMRVEAPFRKTKKVGLVIHISSFKPKFKTLPILRILDEIPLIPHYYMSISEWISNYYGCSINEAIHLFVTPGKRPIPLKYKIKQIPPFYPLNTKQNEIYKDIKKSLQKFYPALIFGVTGSGKTEVYRHLVKDVVDRGKQAVILVPEISLTPQTIERFASIFGIEKISIINSRITPSNKLHNYYDIKNKKTPIILGPRSALFTPTDHLGIIIIDEEQESSYKSSESPRYNAKQVALKIAQHLNIPIILGSATPSLETFYAAKNNKIGYFELKKRFSDIIMPKIKMIDLKNEKGDFSKELVESIFRYKKEGKQSILFINRRGFSPVIICQKCGYKFLCPNCSVSLTYHNKDAVVTCHYCDYTIAKPKKCTQCDGFDLAFLGLGTEKLENEIQNIFHNFSILRMDRDTTSKKGSHFSILEQFKEGKADILVGTQMVAKGLDFDKVKLVGVVNADITLSLPDFRSSENTFSLLTQVAGRAGRKSPGEVIVQTNSPDVYVLKMVKKQDYEGFFEKEIQLRKQFLYPPFSRIIRLVFRGEDLNKVIEISKKTATILDNKKLKFFGPLPCPLEKINKNFRYHLFLKSKQVLPIVKIIKKEILAEFNKIKNFYIELDVDPLSML